MVSGGTVNPLAGEEALELGWLTVLQARISPGDEVMKVLEIR